MSAWRRYFGDNSVSRPEDKKSTSRPETHVDIALEKPSKYSRYMNMLLQLDEVPWWHNILASLCTWLLLAGYVVLPGAFTSIRNSQVLSDEGGAVGKAVVKAAQTWPVLLVASICCAIGVSGMGWLWHKWRGNYVWLLNKIIVPGMLNSLAGLIATITNIYTARNKFWSRTAIITAGITSTCACILMILFLVHNFWNLRHVKEEHERSFPAEMDKREADSATEEILRQKQCQSRTKPQRALP